VNPPGSPSTNRPNPQQKKKSDAAASGADIDAMVLYADSALSPSESAQQADWLVKKQAEIEQRVWERLQVEMSNQMREQSMGTSMTNSRPATSGPRPYSSEQQSRVASAQNKAAWTAGTLYSVAAVPNHDASRTLNHADLERDLTERVLASQPDRSGLGFNEIIMRDIANSVVRELVGIFESLMDRLLIEKKQDTLRTLVAELITEDTLKVMATSRDQLKQRELGHITGELERLGFDAREREQNWEQRFLITQELRDSQDDLYATLSERCQGIEDRLGAVEQNSVQRPELDQRFQHKVDEVAGLKKEVTSHRDRVEAVSNQLADHQRHSTNNFVLRLELDKCKEQLSTDIRGCQDNITSGLQQLSDNGASKAELQSSGKEIDDRISIMHKQLSEAQDKVDALEIAQQTSDKSSYETYCTKEQHKESFSKLETDANETTTKVLKTLEELEAGKATKIQLEEVVTSVRTSLTELNQSLAKTSAGLEQTTGNHIALGQRVDHSFATREYVEERAKSLIEDVVQKSDTREEMGRLWKEFEAEKERLRQTVRQQQHTRKELNDSIEDVQSLKSGAGEVTKQCELLDSARADIEKRVTANWETGQEGLRAQKQVHDDLETFYKTLRDEFIANKDFQITEGDRLKSHSTMRYMEQIDKALNLSESVEKVVRENRELNDSMRARALPPLC